MIRAIKNILCKALYYATFKSVCIGACDNCKV